jgi:hypothetical protein
VWYDGWRHADHLTLRIQRAATANGCCAIEAKWNKTSSIAAWRCISKLGRSRLGRPRTR